MQGIRKAIILGTAVKNPGLVKKEQVTLQVDTGDGFIIPVIIKGKVWARIASDHVEPDERVYCECRIEPKNGDLFAENAVNFILDDKGLFQMLGMQNHK